MLFPIPGTPSIGHFPHVISQDKHLEIITRYGDFPEPAPAGILRPPPPPKIHDPMPLRFLGNRHAHLSSGVNVLRPPLIRQFPRKQQTRLLFARLMDSLCSRCWVSSENMPTANSVDVSECEQQTTKGGDSSASGS